MRRLNLFAIIQFQEVRMSADSINYKNFFELIGKSKEEVDARIAQIFDTFFYGSEDERIYHPAPDDTGYLEDTGNHDARTEGMSYGMMYCVQTGRKEEFDRIWKWAYTHMWHFPGTDDFNEGYFAWSCGLDGTHNAEGAAPDGEEFFAMSLFFASHRWGDGEGIFEYSKHARDILSACLHKGENGRPGVPMWNRENKQILFVAGIDYTDPSYHLPHFYTLFSKWANEEDREFFAEAAKVSREYLVKACHPVTGMNPEYAEFDGSPMSRPIPWTKDRHDCFYSDSYRTAANIGLDYLWNGIDVGQCAAPLKLLRFLDSRLESGAELMCYEIDGTPTDLKALHPVGLIAATIQGILAIEREGVSDEDHKLVLRNLQRLWDMPMREGGRRYYDNCLYLFAFLALGGQYRIW